MQKKYVIMFLAGFVGLIAVLGVFFVLTTTLSSPKAFQLKVPADSEKESTIDSSANVVNILLLQNGKTICYKEKYNDSQLSMEQLQNVLLKEKETTTDLLVVIRPTEEVSYKLVVDMLDMMQVCNIKKYAVVDVTEEDKKFAAYVLGKWRNVYPLPGGAAEAVNVKMIERGGCSIELRTYKSATQQKINSSTIVRNKNWIEKEEVNIN
ncbi:MAG: biopolymer transporter ExbD [Chitinophagaceae bacterium]|nr:biopolymer transporter ExbD [Chitinophagaceae bacterium]